MVVFQLSAKLFWGYNVNINPNDFKSNEEIIYYLQNDLCLFLEHKNLLDLLKEAKKMKLHIHDSKPYLDSITNFRIIYVCDCKH